YHPTSALTVNQPFVLNMFSQKPKYAASGQPGHVGEMKVSDWPNRRGSVRLLLIERPAPVPSLNRHYPFLFRILLFRKPYDKCIGFDA
ncbi:hypothetical protein, partial [Celeribacter persicus]|uniref:hypothetical protein n=1 Tax=Celeribacter persicus TaxID=1651082 RepID=UPI001B886BB0